MPVGEIFFYARQVERTRASWGWERERKNTPLSLSLSSAFRSPAVVRKFNYTSNNPSSPNSDQHEFSPNTIRMLPREMVRRVYKMITKEKML